MHCLCIADDVSCCNIYTLPVCVSVSVCVCVCLCEEEKMYLRLPSCGSIHVLGCVYMRTFTYRWVCEYISE